MKRESKIAGLAKSGLALLVFGLSLIAPRALHASAIVDSQFPALPAPEIETLPNGLTVAWYLSDNLPMLDVSLHVQAGSRDDIPGKSGISSLVSALLDRGAGKLDAQAISRVIENRGAARFASAGDDSSMVGIHGLAVDADALVDILGKMVVQPTFPESELRRQKERALDYWSHVGDSAGSLSSVVFSITSRAGTPYGQSFRPRDFRKITRDDVVRFYRTHYVPRNSTLLVVGRTDRTRLRAKILESFGAWSGDSPKRVVRNFVDPRALRRKGQVLVVDRPGLTQAQVVLGWPAPSVRSPDKYPLAVANALIGEYFNSRLNSVIRDQLGLTYGISSSIRYDELSARMIVGAATANETVGQLLAKTRQILESIRKGEISEEEVAMAKEYLIGGFPLGVSTLGAVAGRWINGHLMQLGPDYLNAFIPQVSAVDVAAVRGVARRSIALEQAVTVVAGDWSEVEKSLRAAGYRDLKRLRLQDLQ